MSDTKQVVQARRDPNLFIEVAWRGDAAKITINSEQLYIQAFIPEPSVEALDKAVLHRLAGPDEVQLHSMLIGPTVHDPAAKLRPIIHRDGFGIAALCRDSI